MSTSLKVSFEGEIHRCSFKTSQLTCLVLRQAISDMFRGLDDCILQYIDDDGVRISIANDCDLIEAIRAVDGLLKIDASSKHCHQTKATSQQSDPNAQAFQPKTPLDQAAKCQDGWRRSGQPDQAGKLPPSIGVCNNSTPDLHVVAEGSGCEHEASVPLLPLQKMQAGWSVVTCGAGTIQLRPCLLCGRKFNEKAFEKHSRICAKTSTKRTVFDSTASRAEGMAEGMASTKKPDTGPMMSTKTNWKAQSGALRAALNAGKLAKNPPSLRGLRGAHPDQPDQSLVPCPHCERTFSQLAATRHIPVCKATKPTPTALKRGEGRLFSQVVDSRGSKEVLDKKETAGTVSSNDKEATKQAPMMEGNLRRGGLVPCTHCDRSFHLKVFQRHSAVCAKISTKRSVFDSAASRVAGTEAAWFVEERKKGAGGKKALMKRRKNGEKHEESLGEKHGEAKGVANANGKEVEVGWKAQSNALRSAMMKGRMGKQPAARAKLTPSIDPAATAATATADTAAAETAAATTATTTTATTAQVAVIIKQQADIIQQQQQQLLIQQQQILQQQQYITALHQMVQGGGRGGCTAVHSDVHKPSNKEAVVPSWKLKSQQLGEAMRAGKAVRAERVQVLRALRSRGR
jgi:hypothetical protein